MQHLAQNSISSQLENVPFRKIDIGVGDAAILRTLEEMRSIIVSSSQNPYVRKWTEYVIRNVKPNDKWAEAVAVHKFVRDNTRYTNDPDGMEFLQTPLHVLQQIEANINADGKLEQMPALDCDDSTMLSLSLLKSIGFSVALKAISTQPDRSFNHVYGLVEITTQSHSGNLIRKYLPIDCVKRDKPFAWETHQITRAHVAKV